MQTKVFFFDIDGTLVNFDGTILDSTVQALQRLKENGHKLILCTGRSKFQIYDELFRRISFDGIIAGAGTYVEYHDQILRQEQMGPDRIKKLVSYFEERGMLYSLSAPQHLICTPENEQGIAKLFAKCGIAQEVFEQIGAKRFTESDMLAKVEQYGYVEKANYMDSPYPNDKVRTDLRPEFEVVDSSFSVDQRSDGEVSIAGVTKSSGMELIIRHLGFSKDDIIAFGDGPNDIDMIAYAGIGIAMGNAVEEVKQVADKVTAPVGEHGIAKALQELYAEHIL